MSKMVKKEEIQKVEEFGIKKESRKRKKGKEEKRRVSFPVNDYEWKQKSFIEHSLPFHLQFSFFIDLIASASHLSPEWGSR